MLLKAPSEVTNPAIEGTLTAIEPSADVVLREARGRDAGEEVASIGRELPVVSIGQPESWPVTELFDGKLPALLEASRDYEFRLVRLACSFRPKRRGEGIEWARFSVQLLPDASGRQPVAFDIHPREQVQEVKRNFKVGLSPSLKFEGVEGSIGSLEAGLEYPELLPMVSGSGIGETTPSWDYEAVRGIQVVGTRCMHLIVRTPRGIRAGAAALEVTADVVGAGFRIPVILRRARSESNRLEVLLWS